MTNLYKLLQISIGTTSADDFPVLTEAEWESVRTLALRQTVLGVILGGIEKLPLEKQPPRMMKLKWVAQVEKIKKRNMVMDRASQSVSRILDKAGLQNVILKGQGIARLYPKPEYRMSGDVDVLLTSPGSFAKNGKNVYSIDKSVIEIKKKLENIGKGEVGRALYHHIEWHVPGTEIEVHIRPMYFNDPWVNTRFQKWTKRCLESGMNQGPSLNDIGFPVPSAEFNLIYLLVHIYHHLLFEGVGLRQVCDYAVLLQDTFCQGVRDNELKESAVCSKNELREILKSFKMKQFARGMMWVLKEVFNLPEECMLMETDEKMGRFILSEIEQSGNFGKYDERIDHEKMASTTGKFWVRTKFRAHFLRLFPSEILWDIPFRLWHWTWRMRFS